MTMDDDLRKLVAKIPKARADLVTALVELMDQFCDAHLNAEYKVLCRKMAVAVCKKRWLSMKGKVEGWAAGIVYALGRVNFLGDPTQKPHMKLQDIGQDFGTSLTTMQAKAKTIWDALNLMQFHPDWSLPGNMENNPMVWMLEVNGFLMDIRTAPRNVQAMAYEKGIIPYIPADRVIPFEKPVQPKIL